MKSSRKKIKVGDIVIISDCICAHQFEIGETVEVIEADGNFRVSNGKTLWSVIDKEIITTGMSVLDK